jgi:3-dehydroquinate synthetase
MSKKILKAVAVGAVAVATMATVATSQQPKKIEAPSSATSVPTSIQEDYSYEQMLKTMSSIEYTRKPNWAE